MFCPNCGASDQTPGGACRVCGQSLRPAPGAQQPAAPSPWDSGPTAQGGDPAQGGNPWNNTGAAPATPPAFADPTGQPPGYPPGQEGQLAAPPPKKSGKKGVIIAAVAVVVVALIALAVLAFSGFFSPTSYVLRCAAETMADIAAEQEKAMETLGVDTALALPSTGPAHQEYAVTAQMEDMYQVYGVRVNVQSDLPNRELRTDISVEQDGLSMMQFGFDAQDDTIAVRAPALFSGSYGLHTETLGADVNGTPFEALLGIDIDPAASFNIFGGGEGAVVSESGRQALLQLGTGAVDKIDTQKKGSATVSVGDAQLECQQYDMLLPMADAQQLPRSAGEILASDDVFVEFMLARQSGAALAANSVTQSDRATVSAEIRDAFDEAADRILGDITARVYIASDRVRRADFQCTVEEDDGDVPVDLSLEIGGPQHLSDLLAVELRADELSMYYRSSGNHVPVNGLWTSRYEIGLSGLQGSSASVQLTGDVSYDSASAADNFSAWFALGGDVSGSLEAEGTVTANRAASTLYAEIDSLRIGVEGDAMEFEASYTVEPLANATFEPLSPTLLTDMSQSQLDNLMNEISLSVLGLMLL